MTEACTRFELDIERRADNALGPEEARALEEHLSTCASCQAFASLAGEVQARLRASAEDAVREARWPDIERRIDERARQMRRSGWLVPVAFFSTPAVCMAFGLPATAALVMAGGALVTTAVAMWLRARWLRDLAHARASREGFIAFSRRQVDAELRAARLGGAALAAVAVIQVAGFEALGPMRPLDRVAVVGGALVLLLGAATLILREAPRLRRERAELS